MSRVRTSSLWFGGVALFWLCLPILKLQVSRLVPFDAFVIVVVAGFAVMALRRRWRPVPGGLLRTIFYASVGVMVVAGFASGLHASEVNHWLLETAIFGYVLVLLACVDGLARGNLHRFLQVGAVAVAVMSVGFGVFAAADLFTGYRLEILYNPAYDGSPTERFSGPARFCNQWAMFYVAVFPLLLALAVTCQARYRALVIGAIVLGLLTVPLTGSRLGTFLVVAELAAFLALYLLVHRGGGPARKAAGIALVGLLIVALVATLGEQIGESSMARRAFGSFSLFFGEQRVADDWRSYNWATAWEEFSRNPILGIGLGTFRLRHDQHEVHSSYLSLLAEVGLAGLLPYAAACLAAITGLGATLVRQAREGRVDAWLLGLIVSTGAVLALGVHFNTTRQRFVWLILALAVFYADRHWRGLTLAVRSRSTQLRPCPPTQRIS